MKLRVLYHGHCFDGVASAAIFSRFYRATESATAEVSYTPLLHKAGDLFEDEMFDGDENAIVDFKYSTNPRLTWWFDHHQSAFLKAADEVHFRADTSGKKFLDVESKSCAEFIARIANEGFGFRDPSLDPLVKWAHIIDGAFYDSAAQAVELAAPALQLMQVIESVKDEELIDRIIADLAVRDLDDVAKSEYVQNQFQPILTKHRETLGAIERKSQYFAPASGDSVGGVVSFDLVDEGYEGFNKFIPYYLHPTATYTVGITRTPHRMKISVGSNPWSPRPRQHNIATLCERYGGGGHAVVGAVSFQPDEIDQTRVAAREIIQSLRA